jgi:predicted permease
MPGRAAATPWSTIAIVLTLALGTGLNSAVFAVTYGVLFRPLPYHDPARLARIGHNAPLKDLPAWRERLSTAQDVAGVARGDHTLRGLGEPRIVHAAFVTDNFFDVLRALPAAGRLPGNDTGDTGVVLSDRLVRAADREASSVVGSTVTIVDRTFTVLGVMPRGVGVPAESTDIWLPASAASAIALLRNDDRRYGLIARLKPGATRTQLAEEATRVRRELNTAAGQKDGSTPLAAVPIDDETQRAIRPVLWAFTGGALLVLFIACANVASLLVSRTMARERDMAIRLALGASWARILRSLFVEGLLFATAGSALGVGLAFTGLRLANLYGVAVVPRLHAVRIDAPVLLMAMAVACVVAVVCTIGPGLHVARRGISPIVRQTGPPGLNLGRRLTILLAGAQIALSIVVLVAATLFGRSILRLLHVDAGIDPSHVVTMKLMLGEKSLLEPGARQPFVHDLLDRIRAIPGVERAGLASSLPPATSQVEMSIRIVDGPRDETLMMHLVAASPGYVEAIGARLVAGRLFRPGDADSTQPLVVLSRNVARHMFANRDPIGQTLIVNVPGGGGKKPRVIGVVDEVRYSGLIEATGGALYVPWEKLPMGIVHLAVRGRGDSIALGSMIRTVVHEMDPGQPVADIRSLEDVVSSSVADRRLHAFLAASFASLALGIALLGVVATLGRAVSERRHEFAVRAALGSTPRQTVGLVMGHAAKLTLAGVAAGTVLGLLTARWLASYLFGVSPSDPATYSAVAIATTASALLACLVPAFRASRADPATLLRAE